MEQPLDEPRRLRERRPRRAHAATLKPHAVHGLDTGLLPED